MQGFTVRVIVMVRYEGQKQKAISESHVMAVDSIFLRNVQFISFHREMLQAVCKTKFRLWSLNKQQGNISAMRMQLLKYCCRYR